MTGAWSRSEVEAIVQDYFDMLAAELRGESFNKTEHRRRLISLLKGRSEGSIERKHQNISAVLDEMGFPFIDGYKPLSNYQKSLLPESVSVALAENPSIVRMVEHQVDEPARAPSFADILSAMEKPPEVSAKVARPSQPRSLSRLGINYLERESRNRSLGKAGEKFVVDYERARLAFAGKDRLADDVEWIAEIRGDGAGYDVLSFEESGRERLIEVKTTRYGRYTSFFISPNELRFCEKHRDAYHLYRVFSFEVRPKMFALRGSVEERCRLEPTEYRASLI